MQNNKQVLLYIITKSELGGAQGNVYDLISNFHEHYEVHLATGSTGHLTQNVSAIGVFVHLIPNLTRQISLFSDLLAVKECVLLIKKIKPGIIHAHSSKAGVVGRVAGWICRVPTVFTAHGWGFTSGTPIPRRMIALLAEKLTALITSKLICVSESDRLLAQSLGIGSKSSLVCLRYGIDNIAISLANPSQQPPRLIMVARFNEQKDQATLLNAIALLSNHTLHLDLVGSGSSLSSCKALAQSLGIADRVSFLGDRTDVSELLTQSQIFILSTHYEGLPISILEAMRAGLPIVATNVNGVPEEIVHSETGLLVPPKDVQLLADALSTLIQSPDLRQQMGKAGRQKFVQEFTVERMIAETRTIYEQILKN
ncbi:glycosyltransferase family 4 protein [Aetokthonos hydrillicola Thurmond2011]|jgi:glycosyltransferase involved in cell wall biosynthesis|uniref:Glycosyltransferase family 4 protein n=1 Tax=Aetokthonos hydrillicola Thurmond2011 TaxID=2712845 RepID=A0AAP5MCT3_9CYAN|nr:glycosyltransferase family 4 protein [Aetokthonos hydrillicola]MBO3461945.1 glycosyltransferase family 4 protein [Aetokthonos hydrillicola CCALA 1050]MBW4589169.1 glycosyltransferase family 4 protein [Aetokthonos hydrillicola CCALA 1050]MDR9898728.1 glycosyltransferase family 4 protein [Aetokthonos hydrillicola Thurmond2011]